MAHGTWRCMEYSIIVMCPWLSVQGPGIAPCCRRGQSLQDKMSGHERLSSEWYSTEAPQVYGEFATMVWRSCGCRRCIAFETGHQAAMSADHHLTLSMASQMRVPVPKLYQDGPLVSDIALKVKCRLLTCQISEMERSQLGEIKPQKNVGLTRKDGRRGRQNGWGRATVANKRS